jgi:hypothetical protein
MNSKDLTDCATAELLDHALTKARVDPLLQSDDYWMYIRALHLRPDLPSLTMQYRSAPIQIR